jgi:hypothetical protein
MVCTSPGEHSPLGAIAKVQKVPRICRTKIQALGQNPDFANSFLRLVSFDGGMNRRERLALSWARRRYAPSLGAVDAFAAGLSERT